jgi:RNA polymerase sigma-70 factor, ECF subfamily
LISDHRQARLNEADRTVLDFTRKLAAEPARFRREDLEPVRRQGLAEEQILEAVVTTAFGNFLNSLQIGLGAQPDFPPRHRFPPLPPRTMHLSADESRPTVGSSCDDPDAGTVARVRAGDVDAFEELVNRHSRRVYRTLVGILGDPEEARDAMQHTFLKAFQHLGSFQGRSKFSTWLVSIANNTGRQILRERRPTESLDDEGTQPDERFRPTEVRAWTDDPEQLYAKAELRALVEEGVMKLPPKYRVVVVLRDIEQLSTEEAAAALGLGIPTLKSQLLRGRLMLRDALSGHFVRAEGGAA